MPTPARSTSRQISEDDDVDRTYCNTYLFPVMMSLLNLLSFFNRVVNCLCLVPLSNYLKLNNSLVGENSLPQTTLKYIIE